MQNRADLFEACSEIDDTLAENLEKLKQAGLYFIDKNEDLLNVMAAKVVANIYLLSK